MSWCDQLTVPEIILDSRGKVKSRSEGSVAGVIYFRNPSKKTEELLKALSDKGLGAGYLPDVVLSGGCVFRNCRITGKLRKWRGGRVGKSEERLPSNALCPALRFPQQAGPLALRISRTDSSPSATPPPTPLHKHLTPVQGMWVPLEEPGPAHEEV